MSGRLENKVAVVTGSGQGIGRAIAMALSVEGAKVVTNNRSPGSVGGDAETTAKEIRDAGGQAVSFFGDVSSFEVSRKLIQTAVDTFGKLDILVNNAGYHIHRELWDLSEEDWDMTLTSHLKGCFNCTRHACVLMKDQGWGRIINCTSASWLGSPMTCCYGAAKAGIVGFTRCAARDLGRYGITCNVYHPTAYTRSTRSTGSTLLRNKRYELGLLTKEQYERPRPGPEAAGPLVAYLATDEAADINGQVFYVVGGDVAIYSEPMRKESIHKDEGFWTVAELIEQVPKILLKGYKNPMPAGKPKQKIENG